MFNLFLWLNKHIANSAKNLTFGLSKKDVRSQGGGFFSVRTFCDQGVGSFFSWVCADVFYGRSCWQFYQEFIKLRNVYSSAKQHTVEKL